MQIRDWSLFITWGGGGGGFYGGITRFVGEQGGGSVVIENPKGGIVESFGFRAGSTQICLKNEGMGRGVIAKVIKSYLGGSPQ